MVPLSTDNLSPPTAMHSCNNDFFSSILWACRSQIRTDFDSIQREVPEDELRNTKSCREGVFGIFDDLDGRYGRIPTAEPNSINDNEDEPSLAVLAQKCPNLRRTIQSRAVSHLCEKLLKIKKLRCKRSKYHALKIKMLKRKKKHVLMKASELMVAAQCRDYLMQRKLNEKISDLSNKLNSTLSETYLEYQKALKREARWMQYEEDKVTRRISDMRKRLHWRGFYSRLETDLLGLLEIQDVDVKNTQPDIAEFLTELTLEDRGVNCDDRIFLERVISLRFNGKVSRKNIMDCRHVSLSNYVLGPCCQTNISSWKKMIHEAIQIFSPKALMEGCSQPTIRLVPESKYSHRLIGIGLVSSNPIKWMILNGIGLVDPMDYCDSLTTDVAVFPLVGNRIYYCLEERALSDAIEKGREESQDSAEKRPYKEQAIRKFLTKIYTREQKELRLEKNVELQVTATSSKHRHTSAKSDQTEKNAIDYQDFDKMSSFPDILEAEASSSVPEETKKVHFASASIVQLCETATFQSLLQEQGHKMSSADQLQHDIRVQLGANLGSIQNLYVVVHDHHSPVKRRLIRLNVDSVLELLFHYVLRHCVQKEENGPTDYLPSAFSIMPTDIMTTNCAADCVGRMKDTNHARASMCCRLIHGAKKDNNQSQEHQNFFIVQYNVFPKKEKMVCGRSNSSTMIGAGEPSNLSYFYDRITGKQSLWNRKVLSNICRWHTCHRNSSLVHEDCTNDSVGGSSLLEIYGYLCPFHVQLARFILMKKMVASPSSSLDKKYITAGYKECCKYLPGKPSSSSFSLQNDENLDDCKPLIDDSHAQIKDASQLLWDLEKGTLAMFAIKSLEGNFFLMKKSRK